VVFPIYTPEGKLLTWGGRTVNGGIPKTRKKRSGRATLYGLWELQAESRLDYLILVEGEFDCMYLQQCGYNAVSAMGTATLADKQVGLIKRYAKRAIISYDGDSAGIIGAKATEKILKEVLPTYRVKVPKGSDPNELAVEAVKKLYRGRL